MHLTIAYDAKRLFHNQTGLGNYSRTLLSSLIREYPDCHYILASKEPEKHPWNEAFFAPPCTILSPGSGIPSWYWRSYRMLDDLSSYQPHIFHGLSGEIPKVPRSNKVPIVLTVHDLLFMDFPEDYNPVDRNIYKLKLNYALRRADKIIAISESTREALLRNCKIDSEQIEVVYQGVDKYFEQDEDAAYLETFIQAYKLPESFLLFTGSWGGRKNLRGLIAALKIARLDIPLVITGKTAKSFKESGDSGTIISMPGLDKRQMRALYWLATALVFPSKGEGFGLPVVEAMMCGTPVVTSNCSSLPEAAGHAALQTDPNEPESIADAIRQVVQDEVLRKTMIEKGYVNALRFDPDRSAQKVMEIYLSLQR